MSATEARHRVSAGVVAAAIVAWLAATAWLRPLMLPDEGRYVGVAWEMLRSGDWLTPTLNGLPFFHKPPLFYWITAGAMAIFGPHDGIARVASVLGASLGAFALYLFLRRWASERLARIALVALLLQPLYYVGGQFANLDMLVAGCITTTILLAAYAALSEERGQPARGALAGSYAMAALGVLSKGLIGIVLPALVITAWLAARRQGRIWRRLVWIPGLALFALIAAPWFVAMQARYPEFLDYFFVVQHFKRFAAGGFNNVQPAWFYPVVVALLTLPLLPWLGRLVDRAAWVEPERGPVRLLMGTWLAVVLLFFSIPQSKLIGYVLPAVPPLVTLLAEGFLRVGVPSPRQRRLWTAGLALSGLASLGTVVGLAVAQPHSLHELAAGLAAQRRDGEPVLMLGRYYYDVPFYARLPHPLQVVDDWTPDGPVHGDDWHRELSDAARFADRRATALLVPPAALSSAACGSTVSWVIGPLDAPARFAVLDAAEVAYRTRDVALWKLPQASVTPAGRDCEGKPNAG